LGFATTKKVGSFWTPMRKYKGPWLVFRLFRETGTAFAVMQQFAKSTLRFPKRSYGGAWNGKLILGLLTHSRVLNILKNPSYAGMYVFGRYLYRRQINALGA
jgi:Recombinase